MVRIQIAPEGMVLKGTLVRSEQTTTSSPCLEYASFHACIIIVTTQLYTPKASILSHGRSCTDLPENKLIIGFFPSYSMLALAETPAASGEKTVPPPCIVEPFALSNASHPLPSGKPAAASQASR